MSSDDEYVEEQTNEHVHAIMKSLRMYLDSLGDIYGIVLGMGNKEVNDEQLYNLRELLAGVVHLRELDLALCDLDEYLISKDMP